MPHNRQAEQPRDLGNGRYAHKSFDILCVCGHPLGEHTAARVRGEQPCLHGTDTGHPETCGCPSFRKAKTK